MHVPRRHSFRKDRQCKKLVSPKFVKTRVSENNRLKVHIHNRCLWTSIDWLMQFRVHCIQKVFKPINYWKRVNFSALQGGKLSVNVANIMCLCLYVPALGQFLGLNYNRTSGWILMVDGLKNRLVPFVDIIYEKITYETFSTLLR